MPTLATIIGPPNVYQSAVIAGIESVTTEQGYEMRLFAGDERDHVLETPDLSGVLVVVNTASDALLGTIKRAGLPISLIAHQVPHLPIPVVMSNNPEGIAALMQHLVVKCKCRAPVFVRGLIVQNDAIERERAFRQELIHYHLRVPESHYLRGDFEPDIAADSIRQFVASGISFDAVVVSDYMMAIAVTQALRAAGCAVPGQVSVVGFGDAPEAEAAGLTTVAANILELGASAARQLISQINGVQITGVTMLGVRLVVRETSCPE